MSHSGPTEEPWPSEVYIDRLLEDGNADCTECGHYGLLRATGPDRFGCLGCGEYATIGADGVVKWDGA